MKEKNFKFTSRYIEKLKSLNSQINKEEKRLTDLEKKLRPHLKELLDAGEIDDSNFYFKMQCFSDNTKCNKRHKVEEGDPIFEYEFHSTDYFVGGENENEEEGNWNEYKYHEQDYAPVSELPFCFSMHWLVFHSDLSWQDLADIDYVWFDLKIDYQLFFKTKNPTGRMRPQ